MKQKLISLLTLLLCVCSGAWAQDPTWSINTSSVANSEWAGVYLDNTVTVSCDLSGSNSKYENGYYNLGNNGNYNTNYVEVLSSRRITKICFLISSNSNNKDCKPNVLGWEGESAPSSAEADFFQENTHSSVSSGYSNAVWTEFDLSSKSLNRVRIYRCANATTVGGESKKGTSTQTIRVFGVKVWLAPATPSLVGAWEISSTDVTGETVNVVQDAAAPTIPTFTVGATSGTPMASNYSVAYSLKAGSTEGIFTYTSAGGPTAISTATAGSATIVATLTTNDDAAFLTPATNTFEYTVVVSEAHAPSIAVICAGNVARGGELIMNANVTEAVPKISYIKWYACDSEGNIDGDALGEELNYAPSTSSVGTYYYRAVVNNGIGGDVNHDVFSTVQTITIVPKAPTMTAGGVFVTDSKDIEIAKADGEDASAVIKYSINNGETWIDFNSLNITETTTVKAKVVQDGLESDVVTATFTKIVLDEQVDVSGAATWDWSEFGTKEIKFTDSTNPSKNDEFVLSNVVKYGHCGSIDASFGNAQQLKVTCEYPVRDNAYLQGGSIKFTTTLAGTITVTYSNTGNRDNEEERRYLCVNGTKYGDGTMKSSADVTTTVFIDKGDIELKGKLKKDDSDQYLRFKKIVFTPLEGTTAKISHNYATFSHSNACALAVPDGVSAFGVSDNGTDHVTLTKYDVIPANTGVILYSESKTDVEFEGTNTSSTYAAANYMVPVTDNGTNVPENSYVLAWDKHNSKVVFAKVASTTATLNKGQAYLTVPATARFNTLFLDEDSETTGISSVTSQADNRFYNLRGQRVAQPQKGLYIVNGKKVVIK